jgi:hypothetical protein
MLRGAQILLAVLCLLVLCCNAYAASFCAAGVGVPPQCYYSDISSCLSSAQSMGGICVINPDSSPMLFGGSNYCTVQSDLTAQCIFVDREQCNSEAAKNNAICINRSDIKKPLQTPDPFRYDDRIQN